MAAPAFRSKTDAIQAAATTITVTTPSAAASGDVLLLVLQAWATSTWSVTTPSGWTLLQQDDTSNFRRYLYWRALTGSPPANYTVTGSKSIYWQACMLAYSGADGVDVSASSQPAVPSTITSLIAPSITTTLVDTCHVVAVLIDGGLGKSFTPPGGFTERADFIDSNVQGYLSVADATQAPAGATGTKTFTVTSIDPLENDYFAISVALKLAAAAGAAFVPRVIASY